MAIIMKSMPASELPKVTVIIPFFQREHGILALALKSIAAQHYPAEQIEVIVVDDGSPISGEEEIHQCAGYGLNIRVIRQQNAGPNEARNKGLEAISPDTDCIAYLDSDDEWSGEHLLRAVTALKSGVNAYFANLIHLGDTQGEFEKARRVKPEDHPQLADDPSIRLYQGDMAAQIVTANIIFMPTLVISAAELSRARFPLAHRHGGGDYLYWLALIAEGAIFAFSTQVEVRCGRGINMWYANGWGTDGFAKRTLDEARFRRKALDQHITNQQARSALERRICELQTGILLDSLHRLLRRKRPDWEAVSSLFRDNPFTVATLSALSKAVLRKIAPTTGRG